MDDRGRNVFVEFVSLCNDPDLCLRGLSWLVHRVFVVDVEVRLSRNPVLDLLSKLHAIHSIDHNVDVIAVSVQDL